MKPSRRLSLGLLAAFSWAAPARAANDAACSAAVTRAAHVARLPAHILPALALVESGRALDGRILPWPWTIDVDGRGQFFETKSEAIAAVRADQAAGARSIDVGCMQINLLMHPGAFPSLDDAFDPAANARYGAEFLRALYAASGQWGTAITAYHSSTPGYADDYARKVLAVWPGAAMYGLAAMSASGGTASAMVEARHDYTAAFARRVAADMAARRARLARMRLPASSRSLLRVASASQRHGPAWPRGVP